MESIEIMPGLTLQVDTEKFDIQGGIRITLDERWSNEVLIQLDAALRDVLEDNETKVQGVLKLRQKHG